MHTHRTLPINTHATAPRPCAVAGAFYYATPQAGSFLANPGSKVFSGPMLDRLKVLDEAAVDLNNQFRTHFPQVQQMGLYEMKALSVLPKGLQWLPLGVLVVPVASAKTGVANCIPRPEDDHISICKPKSKGSENYLYLTGFIKDALEVCPLVGVSACGIVC
jgi:hypothetical protein